MFSCSDDNAEDDDKLYCYECDAYHMGDCPDHGPMLRILDTVVAEGDPLKAINSLPKNFTVRHSSIPGAGLGVWAHVDVVKGTVFGPFEGKVVALDSIEALSSEYCWQIKVQHKPSHCIDGREMATSNWMRYVNCANKVYPQNLKAFQYKGQIYYRAMTPIAAGSEMLVCYGRECTKVRGQDWGKSDKSIDNARTAHVGTRASSLDAMRGVRRTRQFLSRHAGASRFPKKHPLLEHKGSKLAVPLTNKDGSLRQKPLPSLESIRCQFCQLHFNYESVLNHHISTEHQNQLISKTRPTTMTTRMRTKIDRNSKSIAQGVKLKNKMARQQRPREVYQIYQKLMAHQRSRNQNGLISTIGKAVAAKPSVSTGQRQRTESGGPENESLVSDRIKQESIHDTQSSSTDGSGAAESNGKYPVEQPAAQLLASSSISLIRPASSKPITNFKCEHCPLSFCSIRNVRRHAASKHPELKDAGKQSGTANLATSLLKSENDLVVETKDGIQSTSSQEKNESTAPLNGERRFVCRVCGWATKRMNNLMEHELTQHEIIVVYKCLECLRCFDFHRDLRAHQSESMHKGIDRISVGPGDDPINTSKPAPAADQDVSTEADLGQGLMPRAERLRPHKCNVCHARFAFFSKLRKHQLTCKTRGKIKWNFPKLRAHQNNVRPPVVKEEDFDPWCEDDLVIDEDEPELAPESEPDRKRSRIEVDPTNEETERAPVPNQAFVCHMCDASFALIDSLQYHLANHADIEQQSPSSQAKESQPRPFACDKCASTFTRNDALKRHLLEVHVVTDEQLLPAMADSQPRPFACHLCAYSSSRVDRLKRHQVKFHNMDAKSLPALKDEQLRPFACFKCPATFSRIDNLRIHRSRKHGIVPGSKQELNDVSRIAASRVETPPKKFPCAQCGSSFSRMDNFRIHQFRKHGINVQTLSVSKGASNVKTPPPPPPAIKEVIGAVSLIKTEPPKKFPCQNCDSSFSRMDNLKLHLTRKHGINTKIVPTEKPAAPAPAPAPAPVSKMVINVKTMCVTRVEPEVDQVSKTKTSLSDEQLRPFPCRKCGSAFSRIDNLRHHYTKKHGIDKRVAARTESAKLLPVADDEQLRPFSCGSCDLAFSRLDTLKRHQARKHDGAQAKSPASAREESSGGEAPATTPKEGAVLRPYVCDVCHASFTRNDTLRRHKLEQHVVNVKQSTAMTERKPRLFVCHICQTSFTRIDRLKRHAQEKHGGVESSLPPLQQQPASLSTSPVASETPVNLSCKLCSYSCNRIDRLKNHQVRVHNMDVESPPVLMDEQVKLITCTICNSAFVHDANLRRHLMENHGIAFKRATPARPTPLEATPTSKEAKSFVCDVCDYSTTRIGRLRSHKMRLHGIEDNPMPVLKREGKPAQQRAVSDSPSVKPHVERRLAMTPSSGAGHVPSPFACHLCEYACSRIGRLRNHQIKIHRLDVKSLPALNEEEMKPFHCKICQTAFSRIDSLRIHETRKHNVAQRDSARAPPSSDQEHVASEPDDSYADLALPHLDDDLVVAHSENELAIALSDDDHLAASNSDQDDA